MRLTWSVPSPKCAVLSKRVGVTVKRIEHVMEKPRLCYLKLFRAFAIVYLWGLFDSLAVTASDYIFLYHVGIFVLSFIYC